MPTPGVLDRNSAPPDCAASPCTIERPSPVPFPRPFVEKNGSMACFSVEASMPMPLSVTLMRM